MLAESPFDYLAPTYDADFTNSRIGRLQRNRVWELLSSNLPVNRSLSILEINCGTGEDALWLARKGHQVLATDISADMLSQARLKTQGMPGISFEKAAFHELHSRYGGRSFDLIFSNFGGLNCADMHELEALNEVFAAMIKPGGQLIIVLMGRYCLLERWYFRLKLQYKETYRRMKPLQVQLHNAAVQSTWYYDTGMLQKAFSHFKLQHRRPVGLFIPPSYLETWARKNPFILSLLCRMDRLWGRFSFLADRGDHIYLAFKRA